MSPSTKSSKLKHLRTFFLFFSVILGLSGLALSGYLFHQGGENAKGSTTTTGMIVIPGQPNVEHRYMNATEKTGVYQFPKGYMLYIG